MKNRTSLTVYTRIKSLSNQTPNASAITAPGRIDLPFSRLGSHIYEIAAILNSMGIGRNDRVAIVLPNGAEMAVAFLAVASCAASAPLNPSYRIKEFDFFLSDLQPKALVIQTGLDSPAIEVAKTHGIKIINLSPAIQKEAGIFSIEGNNDQPDIKPAFAQEDDVALVLHTSGTTSRPKIVPLSHKNIMTSAFNIVNTLKLAPEDRCLNVMPLFHIHGLIGALLSSLTAGGSAICSTGFDADSFFNWVGENKPTWYTAVPTIHQAVLTKVKNQPDSLSNCGLRFIRSSSSSLPPQVMSEMEDLFQVPVIESYGMTEASHQMASNPLPPGKRKPGSVGLPAGPDVSIMDEKGNLMGAGKIGEVVIRGQNVFQGYANNTEANNSSFSSGWFRTGDQGVIDEDGYLSLTGRLKEIINRGGEKISPREIDEVLLDHPDVVQAVAFAVPHPTLEEDVAAAVVLRDNCSVTEKDIRDFTSVRLSDFKVPNTIVFVEEIPKGATGKLQRIGLYKKLIHKLKPEYTAPRTYNEDVLSKIWSKILGVKKIGVNDNFFSMGGDSLRATQIVSRIHETLNVMIPLSTLFETLTISGLSDRILNYQICSIDSKYLSQIKKELETLSEEEAQTVLEEEMSVDPVYKTN